MTLKLSSIALSLVLVTGCSSILSDNMYPVSITSTPSLTNFVLENRAGVTVHSGRTPETVTLNASSGFFKGETYKLIFKKDGYDEKTVEIQSAIDGWYFGNILFGGILGMLIVDPATGAMFKLPEQAAAQLEEQLAENTRDASLTIALLDTIPEDDRDELIPLN
jgi:hypothetical protein